MQSVPRQKGPRTQLPNPGPSSGAISNRDTKLLETVLTHRKQRPAYPSNRDKFAFAIERLLLCAALRLPAVAGANPPAPSFKPPASVFSAPLAACSKTPGLCGSRLQPRHKRLVMRRASAPEVRFPDFCGKVLAGRELNWPPPSATMTAHLGIRT